MFQRAPPRSIMAFENFSSVKAKTRRSTRGDQVIDLGIHVSTPASANTTRVVSEGVAPRLASTSTASRSPN